ncbi:MAG: hypothetical protein QOI31_2333 [Solirubrobacterales bacterium]|nr:hypothetical protein [Solirubrobacterales bacterium]
MALAVALTGAAASVAQAGCPHAGDQVNRMSKESTRDAIVCLFNKERGLNLKENGRLEQSAQTHSAVMRSKECFAHDCPGEPSLLARIAKTGYLKGAADPAVGEILKYAVDYITPGQMVDEWMRSSPHAAVITKSTYEDVGVGLSVKNGSILATAHFGHR